METLSHIIRRFNRFEIKYLLTLRQAEQVRAELTKYLQLDSHGDRYWVSSLYYDAPDLRCYWEKRDGIKFRRKLRLRWYEEEKALTKEDGVFVEIKQRLDRVTQKRRVYLPYAQALTLCNDRQMVAYAVEDRAVIEEVLAFVWQYNLRPVSVIRYCRQAWVGQAYDLGLRVTFDRDLTCAMGACRLEDGSAGRAMFPEDAVVMEIKVNERIPYWLTEMVARQQLQMVRVSKYCQGIEAAGVVATTGHCAWLG